MAETKPAQKTTPEAVSAPQKKKKQFSIMKKISLLILAIVVISISSYAYFAVWQFKNDKLKYIHLVNSTFAGTVARKIQSIFDNTISDMQNVVALLGIKGIDQEKSRALMVMFQGNESFVALTVVRAHSSVPAPSSTPAPSSPTPGATPPPETADSAGLGSPAPAPKVTPTEFSQTYALYNKDFLSLNQLTEDVIRTAAMDEVRTYVGLSKPRREPYFVDRPQSNMLTFVYSLDNQDQYFAVFNVSKDSLFEAVSESEVNDPLLVNESGQILVHKDRSKVGQVLSDFPIYEMAKTNPFREGGMEFSYQEGGEERAYVGNFYKIGHGLTILAQADKGKAFQGMRRIIINTILFAIDIVGLAIIVGVLFSKTLTSPLRKLMTITENIAAGNYSVQSDIRTNDEVGQLSEYFVSLGKRLEEREAQLEKATELAIKDGMTGVYNHRHFKARFAEFFSLAKRHGGELSLILTDIDFFKKFNDTYGHQQGDQVIKDIAQILLQSTRTTDFVARYGGEEFVVVLPETDKVGATQTAERIRQNYKNHKIKNLTGEGFLSSTCSLGVATLKGYDFKTMDEMIEHADKNLYTAKKSGRDRVVAD